MINIFFKSSALEANDFINKYDLLYIFHYGFQLNSECETNRHT